MRLVLDELLNQGHRVHFFGIKGFSEAPSLERWPAYRYSALRLQALDRTFGAVRRIPNPLPGAVFSQLVHAAYCREAIRSIEAAARTEAFDVVLCTDTLELWPSRLPVVSWPQSAPQTEWEALRRPAVADIVRRGLGRRRLLAYEAFYAYRFLHARVSWRASNLILCGSRWSELAWTRFGVPDGRVRALPHPVDLALFAEAPPLRPRPTVTFLWLGRAVARKRFDLFLAAFERIASERADVRAIVVGNVESDPLATRALAQSPARDQIERRPIVPRAAVPALFAESDVLVQPSENENFGASAAEALASGRPVVLGPTNGTADYAGEALFAFHQYDVDAVAQAMQAAAEAVRSDPAGVTARARSAAEALSPSRVVWQLVTVCESLANARP